MEDVVVTPSRIEFMGQYVPRFLDLPRVLQVPAGSTYNPDAFEEWDYVEVSGLFQAARDHDSLFQTTHFFVLPGGVLDLGTRSSPLLTVDARIILSNRPLDLAQDPFQWGNGLLNFGTQYRVGCDKTAYVQAVGDLELGDTEITLAAIPLNWEVGDELLIPDTLTQTLSPSTEEDHRKTQSLRESKVTIAAINGVTLTLSKPLDWPHPCLRDLDGVVRVKPRVANLTRCISIESENAATPLVGVRGHTANLGHSAKWDIHCNQFIQLGRTSNDRLDDFVPATGHQGLNQRGRYADHDHHCGSSPGSAHSHNVYIGNPITTKWGIAVHGTSDILVEENVVLDFPGSGIVTEDGYEVRNRFLRNFSAYINGTPPSLDPDGNVKIDRPGAEGTGYWFRGVMNYFEGNEAWNCYRSGFNLFNQQQPPGMYPSAPGMMPDTIFDPRVALPLSFEDNLSACNNGGWEIWGIKAFPFRRFTSAFNWDRNIFVASSDGIAFELHDSLVLGELGKGGMEADGSMGIHSGDGYVNSFNLYNVEVVGHKEGIVSGGSVSGINMFGGKLQNEVDINRIHQHVLLENVEMLSFPGKPRRHLELNVGDRIDQQPDHVWTGIDPLPIIGVVRCVSNRGSDIIVRNCPGFGEPGKTYRIYHNQAKAETPAWYSTLFGDRHTLNPPVKGITWGEAWEEFGIGYFGGVVENGLIIDGLVYGVALEGEHTPLASPRAIITFPNTYEPIVPSGDNRCQVALTGDRTQASQYLFAQVDDGHISQIEGSSVNVDDPANDQRSFGLDADAVTPGLHTIKAWRTTLADPLEKIPSSEYVVTYSVGQSPHNDAPHDDHSDAPHTDAPHTDVPHHDMHVDHVDAPHTDHVDVHVDHTDTPPTDEWHTVEIQRLGNQDVFRIKP